MTTTFSSDLDSALSYLASRYRAAKAVHGDGTAAYLGLRGIFKLENTRTYTIPNGGSGTKVWEDKNGEEIVADMLAILAAIMSGSNGVEVPNMLALPLSST